MNNVDRIRQCEAEADQLDVRSDALRWEAAELIAAELATGVSQRTLADKIGKHHTHVGFMSRTWRDFGYLGIHDRPSFNDAYQQVKRGSPKPTGTQPAAKQDDDLDDDNDDVPDDTPEWHGTPLDEDEIERRATIDWIDSVRAKLQVFRARAANDRLRDSDRSHLLAIRKEIDSILEGF